MPSNIDPALPVAGTPTTQSVRDNFAAAKAEIEALDDRVATFEASSADLEHAYLLRNLSLSTSRVSNAETVTLKTKAGTDPTPEDPIKLAFLDATGAGFTVITVSAPLSITIPAGSTFGSSTTNRLSLWLIACHNAGSTTLALLSCTDGKNIRTLPDNGTITVDNEGNPGIWNSPMTAFSAAAIASARYRILANLIYEPRSAGLWNSAPVSISLIGRNSKLPGDVVHHQRVIDTSTITGTAIIPWDDTVPQNNEGTQFAFLLLAEADQANLLDVEFSGYLSNTTITRMAVALFSGSEASARAVAAQDISSADYAFALNLRHRMRAPLDWPILLKIHAGGSTAGTTRSNGSNSTRKYGGALQQVFSVTEIKV